MSPYTPTTCDDINISVTVPQNDATVTGTLPLDIKGRYISYLGDRTFVYDSVLKSMKVPDIFNSPDHNIGIRVFVDDVEEAYLGDASLSCVDGSCYSFDFEYKGFVPTSTVHNISVLARAGLNGNEEVWCFSAPVKVNIRQPSCTGATTSLQGPTYAYVGEANNYIGSFSPNQYDAPWVRGLIGRTSSYGFKLIQGSSTLSWISFANVTENPAGTFNFPTQYTFNTPTVSFTVTGTGRAGNIASPPSEVWCPGGTTTTSVAAQPSCTLSAIPSPLFIGTPISVTTTATGGYTPYTYVSYTSSNPSAAFSNKVNNTVMFTPTKSGVYDITATVRDVNLKTVTCSTPSFEVGLKPDITAPNPPVCDGIDSTLNADNRFKFNWHWGGDNSCGADCEPAVGWCASTNTKSANGEYCNAVTTGPFYWEIYDQTNTATPISQWPAGTWTGGGQNYAGVSCFGRIDHLLMLKMKAQDANGNKTALGNICQWVCARDGTDPRLDSTKVGATWNKTSNKIDFTWAWDTDFTCTDCEPAVSYCDTTGKAANAANPVSCSNMPFNVTVKNRAGTVVASGGSGISQRSGAYSSPLCPTVGSETYTIEVEAVDARGNKSPMVVKSADCGNTAPTCILTSPPVDMEVKGTSQVVPIIGKIGDADGNNLTFIWGVTGGVSGRYPAGSTGPFTVGVTPSPTPNYDVFQSFTTTPNMSELDATPTFTLTVTDTLGASTSCITRIQNTKINLPPTCTILDPDGSKTPNSPITLKTEVYDPDTDNLTVSYAKATGMDGTLVPTSGTTNVANAQRTGISTSTYTPLSVGTKNYTFTVFDGTTSVSCPGSVNVGSIILDATLSTPAPVDVGKASPAVTANYTYRIQNGPAGSATISTAVVAGTPKNFCDPAYGTCKFNSTNTATRTLPVDATASGSDSDVITLTPKAGIPIGRYTLTVTSSSSTTTDTDSVFVDVVNTGVTCDSTKILMSPTGPYLPGQTNIAITADASGGPTPPSYRYNWDTVSGGTLKNQSGATPTATDKTVIYTAGLVPAPGYQVSYEVYDASNSTQRARCGVTFAIQNTFSCDITASTFSPAIGQAVPVTANPRQGVGPFTYLWGVPSAGSTLSSRIIQSPTFTATTSGAHPVQVTVTDTGAGNITASCSAQMNVSAPSFYDPIVNGLIYYDYNRNGVVENWCHPGYRYETRDYQGETVNGVWTEFLGRCRSYNTAGCHITNCTIAGEPTGYLAPNVDMSKVILTADNGQVFDASKAGSVAWYSFSWVQKNYPFRIDVTVPGSTKFTVSPSNPVTGTTGPGSSTLAGASQRRDIGLYKAANTAPTCSGITKNVAAVGPNNTVTFTAGGADTAGDTLKYNFTVNYGNPLSESNSLDNVFTWVAPATNQTGVTVRATVIDQDGASTACPNLVFNMGNVVPTCTITVPAANSVFPPNSTVTVTANVKDPQAGTVNLAWNGGTYNPATRTGLAVTAAGVNSQTIYTTPNVYGASPQISLTVTDPQLNSSTCALQIATSQNNPPTCTVNGPASVAINSVNTFAMNNATRTFNLVASDTDGDTITVSNWTLGQGSPTTSTAQSFSWTAPASPVTFNLVATITDGKSNVQCTRQIVVDQGAPVCSFTNPVSGTIYAQDTDVSLTLRVSDPENQNVTYTFGSPSSGSIVTPPALSATVTSPYPRDIVRTYHTPNIPNAEATIPVTVRDTLSQQSSCAIVIKTPPAGTITANARLSDENCTVDLGALAQTRMTLTKAGVQVGVPQLTTSTGTTAFNNLTTGAYTVAAYKDQYIPCQANLPVTLTVAALTGTANFKLYPIPPRGYITLNQGNLTAQSNYSKAMPATKTFIQNYGSGLFNGSTSIGSGVFGSKAYHFTSYHDETDLPAFLQRLATLPNGNNQGAASDIHVMAGGGANPILPNGKTQGNAKIVVVKGDLTLPFDLTTVEPTLIVLGNLKIDANASGVPDVPLTITGGVYVTGSFISLRDAEVHADWYGEEIDSASLKAFGEPRSYWLVR